MDITVIVPLYNEEESLPELYAWIERVMNANGFSYEVIFVNDGSTDRSWQVIEQLAEKSDIPMYLGLIPSAAEVWRDKLPEGAESWDQNAYLSQAAGLGLAMIDFSAALTAHADEPIFYRTDHHWTSLGAFYGANALLEVLGRESLKQESFTPEIASTSFNGTLYSQSGIHWLTPDTMEFWVKEDGLTVTSWRTGSPEPGILYDRSYLTEKDKYASFLGGNQPLCVIWNENARDGGKLLLIRDSYSDALAPFLALILCLLGGCFLCAAGREAGG